MVRPAGPDIWVQSLGAMACAPLREPGTALSEGGIRGPAPEKVFRSVPFCAVSYVAGGTPGKSLGRFWRTNGRQMDAFGTKWNGLLDGVGGGAAVYLLFRSRAYNSTGVRCRSRLAEVFSTGIVPMRQMSFIPARPPFGNWRLGPHTPCLAADRLPEGRTHSGLLLRISWSLNGFPRLWASSR